jgi:CheY-like chemotaxis protein
VLLNLLSNAVKFTDRGGVRLQVRFSPPARLSFEVRDTGIGIRADQIETIFEPFEQVAEASRRLGGTGLGLTISRRLVRRMGGELQVRSNFGEGSTFWFELEVPVLDQEEEQRAMSAPAVVAGYEGPRRRILVVDDVAYNRAVLIDWLRSAGFDSAEAANGREALEQAVALRPDLIVMDLIMAQMHGLEAIRSLRQRPYFSEVPIIAISASVSEQDAWKSVQAGADAFLPKPIDLAQLQVQIARLLELKWTYTQTVPRREDRAAPEALVAPPGSEMELLYDLAQQGSMRDIARQAAYVASLDERYCPFAQELQRLAGRYESQAILALIERHREGGSNSS